MASPLKPSDLKRDDGLAGEVARMKAVVRAADALEHAKSLLDNVRGREGNGWEERNMATQWARLEMALHRYRTGVSALRERDEAAR